MEKAANPMSIPASAPRKRRHPELSARQRALGLLTRREHSRKELARKLAGSGVEPTEAAEAIDLLGREGWQDDARFATSLAHWRAASGCGPLRIRAELRTHAVDPQLVDAAFAALAESGEADWEANAKSLLGSRYGHALRDPAIQRKAAGYLARRGFDTATIRAACGMDMDEG